MVPLSTRSRSCLASTISPRSNGRPASISVANWRVKIISVFGLIVFFWKRTMPPFLAGAAEALAAATVLVVFFFAARALCALPSSITLVGK